MRNPTTHSFSYDVFVSYSQSDRGWVVDTLLPRLERARLKVYLDHRDTAVGNIKEVAIDQAIEHSRKILLVLTPEWLNDEWSQFQGLLAQSQDPAGYSPRVVPLIFKPCALPPRLAMISAADFTATSDIEQEWRRVLRSLDPQMRIYVVHEPASRPDRALAMRIGQELQLHHYHLVNDSDIPTGQDWARALQTQIEQSDFVVVLLSEAAFRNEIFLKKVEHAYWTNQRFPGQARLLPVRANYQGSLPNQLNTYLGTLRYAEWRPRTKQSMRQVAAQILEAIVHNKHLPAVQLEQNITSEPTTAAPLPAADPQFVNSLPSPGGALDPLEIVYIERNADNTLKRELSKPRGTTITIRGPRQSGKSSLLIRGLAQAKQTGSEAVFINLEPIDKTYLENADTFYRYFASNILYELGLDTKQVTHYWDEAGDAAAKITRLVEEYVLKQIPSNLILAIDEADRVWGSPISDSFFGLLRHWHNIRRVKNLLWPRLSVLVVISTEPHLVISSAYQSPFNIGSRIELDDFTETQVHDLHLRYRAAFSTAQRAELIELLGGHPYLSSKALYLTVAEEIPWEQIKRTASSDRGPFSDHLRRYWWLLRDQPELVEELKNVLQYQRCADTAYHRLSRAGLIKGDDSRACAFRCKLYEDYFRRQLG